MYLIFTFEQRVLKCNTHFELYESKDKTLEAILYIQTIFHNNLLINNTSGMQIYILHN